MKEELRKLTEMASLKNANEKEVEIINMIKEKLKKEAKNGNNYASFEIKNEDLTGMGLKKEIKVDACRFNPSIAFREDLNFYEEDLKNEAKTIYQTLESFGFVPITIRSKHTLNLRVSW